MELYAKNMHFLGNTENDRAFDTCIHGKIVFSINGTSLSQDDEWCVSASAYRFLHTLTKDHKSGNEDFLIPCCGHFMIPSDDKTSVTIIGCSNGIDFDVIHNSGKVTVRSEAGDLTVPFSEYKAAVSSFADQVEAFFEKSPERRFNSDFDRDGFEAFRNEWTSLRLSVGDN